MRKAALTRDIPRRSLWREMICSDKGSLVRHMSTPVPDREAPLSKLTILHVESFAMDQFACSLLMFNHKERPNSRDPQQSCAFLRQSVSRLRQRHFGSNTARCAIFATPRRRDAGTPFANALCHASES